MEQVTGIGGIFFKARDPVKMAAWYRDCLGLGGPDGTAEFVFRSSDQPAAPEQRTVWSLFPADTDYFGPGPTPFLVNYRVANLDKMLAQLQQAGVAVDKVEDHDYGRFAWLSDPEGNRLELWEPKNPAQP